MWRIAYTFLDRLTRPANSLFAAIAATVLVSMMFLTALDVGLRYLLNSPLPGAIELVEYMMALMVPFAVVVAAYNKAHIGVELLLERFSKRVQNIVGCMTCSMEAVLYALITWQSFLNIIEQFHSGMTSAVLLIPHYPFVISLAAAFALLTLITLLHLFKSLSEVTL
jgi:TRAP-type transport system small permease protein